MIQVPPLTRSLGRHLGTAQGLEHAILEARQIGCTAAQIFPGNPKGWRHVPIAPERAAAACAGWREAGVGTLAIHAPYIINLASPDDSIYALSRQALLNALTRGMELGAKYVIVHLGSHKGSGVQAGAARLLSAAIEAISTMPERLFLLLENNVGAGNAMGGTLDALGNLVRDAAHPRIGVCMDTAHLWGAGHDISTSAGVDAAMDDIDRSIGLPHVQVLHLNDSPMALGSHRDQHAHLGQGQIGYEGLAAVLTHPGMAGIPAIMETPDGGVEEEIVRWRAAALLCAGDSDGARRLQDTLPAEAAGATAPDAATGMVAEEAAS